MKLRAKLWTAAIGLGIGMGLTAIAPPALAQQPAPHPGKAIYDTTCAACHNEPGKTPGTERAAQLSVIRNTSEQDLRNSLTGDGVMAPMAAGLSGDQLTQLIGWLTSEQKATAASWDEAMMCAADNRTVDVSSSAKVTYFGGDIRSTRSLSAKQVGISKKDIPNLEVAYTLGVPRAQGMGVGVTSIGDTTFFNAGGKLIALDADKGCARWIYDGGSSRTTPQIADINGTTAIIYTTGSGDVTTVNAQTGEEIWKASGQPENGVGSTRGGVLVYKDKVIVPISASGVATGMRPTFECCDGHGAVVALSAKDGSRLWEYHTMKDAEYNGLTNSQGVKQKGPSGAPIWSMPTIDEKHNALIVTTGENTSMPATNTSDAIIALDLDTGKQKWLFQAMEHDVWNMACRGDETNSGPNCPWHFDEANIGRDFDFGSAAIVTRTKGNWFGMGARDIILAGQKSGHLWALDATTGERIWDVRVGGGSPLGGNHWGIAADGQTVFHTIADSIPSGEAPPAPGVYAYDIKDGKALWSYESKPQCGPERAARVVACEIKHGFSATPLVVDGVLVAGTLDGKVFFFDGKTGDILKTFDTAVPYETSNGVEAKGGSIDAHAVSAGAGHIFIGSGYGSFGQTPGNALVVLKPAE